MRLSKGARISRPKAKIEGIESLIKNDQLFRTIDKSLDEGSSLILARVVGGDTLEALAKQIAKLHKPIEFNWHAKFGLAELPQTAAPVAPVRPVAVQAVPPIQPTKAVPATYATASTVEPKAKQKLVCHSCSESISYNVAKFCWFNKPRFGGNLYCMDCQKKVVPA